MEPHIQYAKTVDGVSIAYYRLGEGKAILQLPPMLYSHILFQWEHEPGRRAATEWVVGRGRSVVALDPRGLGSSSHDVADFSLNAFVSDVEAVVDALGLSTFDLGAGQTSTPVAIAYAAKHPQRLEHLALYAPAARWADTGTTPAGAALRALHGQDWDTYAQAATHIVAGFQWNDEAQEQAELLRCSTTLDIALRMWTAFDEFDVRSLLPRIRTPTLVALPVPFQQHQVSVDFARAVAADIPGAELVAPTDLGAVTTAMGRFFGIVGNEDVARDPVQVPHPARLVTILFTDIVGHTEMMQRLGDAKGRDVLREHERLTRDTLRAHGGAEVKTMGDGFMASFGSVTQAMDCAIALQRAFAAHEGEPLRVRVGLNAGEPIEEDGDLFGSTVIMTSRIAAKADAGEILVPDTVRGLLSGKGYVYADRGETMLRGFEDAVHLYEVRWRE